MRLEGNKVILSSQDLERAGIGRSAISMAKSRGSLQAINRGEYAYDLLPTSWSKPVKLAHFNGLEPFEYLAAQQAQEAARSGFEHQLEAAMQNHFAYVHRYVDTCGKEKARELAKGASVLEAIYQSLRSKGLTSKKLSALEEAAQAIKNLDVPYLPSNPRRLQEKVRDLEQGKDITEIVKLPRQGNLNAAVHKLNEQLEAFAVTLRASGANFPNAFIIRHLNVICQQCGWKEPSEGWFKAFFASPQVKYLTAPGRFNEGGRHGAKYNSYLPVATAAFAGDCWQMDGTRINMVAHENGGFGKSKTKSGKEYLYIVAVRDVHSGDVLGMHFDYTEDRHAWIGALRMAVANTGYLPYEIVVDRFPGHNTQDWQSLQGDLEDCGVKMTYGKGPTAKAQMERWFETLQSVFMTKSTLYYGEGVKSSRPNAHRTETYLAALKKQPVVGFREALSEAIKVIEAYRNTPICYYSKKKIAESPAQLHELCEKPNKRKATGQLRARLFGEHRKSILRGNLLKVEVDGEEVLLYADKNAAWAKDLDLLSFQRNYAGTQLEVHLEEDLSKAWVYEPETRILLGCLNRFERVLVHGPDAELGRISEHRSLTAQLNSSRKAELARAQQKVDQSGIDINPLQSIDRALDDEMALLLPRSTPKNLQERAESAANGQEGISERIRLYRSRNQQEEI